MAPKRKEKAKPTPKTPKARGKKDEKDKDTLPVVSEEQKEKNKNYWNTISKKKAGLQSLSEFTYTSFLFRIMDEGFSSESWMNVFLVVVMI